MTIRQVDSGKANVSKSGQGEEWPGWEVRW